MSREKQVKKKNYEFNSYSSPGRFSSYYYQLETIFKYDPESVLEVGVGDKVVGDYIKNNSDITYSSVDIAEDLSPDFVGDITDLSLSDNSYDVVVAFQVLEHIPFDDFSNALKEMHRVASEKVILSLPHFGPAIKFSFQLPPFINIKFFWKAKYHPEHTFDGLHYWEIGKKGYSMRRIKDKMELLFTIEEDFIPFEKEYHHFFVLDPK